MWSSVTVVVHDVKIDSMFKHWCQTTFKNTGVTPDRLDVGVYMPWGFWYGIVILSACHINSRTARARRRARAKDNGKFHCSWISRHCMIQWCEPCACFVYRLNYCHLLSTLVQRCPLLVWGEQLSYNSHSRWSTLHLPNSIAHVFPTREKKRATLLN